MEGRAAGARPVTASRSARPRQRAAAGVQRELAAHLPIARVCVDVPLAHLDRPFDYRVSAEQAAAARPGTRVRVRFSGQLVSGYVLERVGESIHDGHLAYLDRVVSPEPVLSAEIAVLARVVADRYAGTLADVLRLAVPPRHARVEAEASPEGSRSEVSPVVDRGWDAYTAGTAFLRAVADGRAPRAVWTALPGEDWAVRLAGILALCEAGGRGALAVVPDARDLDRLDAALTATLGPGQHVALSAAVGPAQRYRRFLAARRGQARIVIGTRAAAFAPVAELGLALIWDDGDDLHAEPHAPYPHTREVLRLRTELAGAGFLLGGFARTCEAQQLLDGDWAKPIVAARETVRRVAPRVIATGDDAARARDAGAVSARLPTLAWRSAHEALCAGTPVLVQVPRRGYLPAVACEHCGNPARCRQCSGPLMLPSASAHARCRWCDRPVADFRCPVCEGRRLRASVVGARRTAEELGRAFPNVVVRTSGRDEVLAEVPAQPALVVATPGAEPVAVGGYGAVLLLDTWALLSRADLRAGEETLRRWFAAAALARPAHEGGRVVVVADAALAPVQALVRWDPGWMAARELAERRELGFPPAAAIAAVSGAPAAVTDLLAVADLSADVQRLGPVPVHEGQERMLLRASRARMLALASALKAAAGVRSARKAHPPLRIQLDPLDVL